MTALWTSVEAARAVGGTSRAEWRAEGVSIDSRTLAPGDLFVALRGPNHDGHDHAASALARGAAAVMLDRPAPGVSDGAPVLAVDDTLDALQALGRAARPRAGTLVGITGSVGKTGTRSMLEAALRPSGPTVASERSLNNHWGVPLTLARIPRNTRYAVIEMGMNAAGEIRRLSSLARPDVAVVTAIAPAHLSAFGTLERIAEAKAEIFEHLAEGGVAVIPDRCPGQDRLARAAAARAGTVWTFGESDEADARLVQVSTRGGATAVRAVVLGAECAWRLGAPGRHWAQNSLAVQLALRAAGADAGRATCALAAWRIPAGRGAAESVSMSPGKSEEAFLLIDDSYNANPASMKAALERLAEAAPESGPLGPGRRIAFLGDMLELGPEEERLHAGLSSLAAVRALDAMHLCGPRMRALHDSLPPEVRGGWEADAESLAERAPGLVRPGDVVLVKGSNGARCGAIASALRRLERGD